MIKSVLRAIYNIFVSDSSHMQRTLLSAALNPDLTVSTQERAALLPLTYSEGTKVRESYCPQTVSDRV